MKRLLLIVTFILASLATFSQSRISLAWNPSTDNVGVAGYCVWVDGVRYDSTVNTQYDFPVFEAGEYWLTVSAYDAAGNESAQSQPFHVIISDITRPDVPEIITVEYMEKSATITWMESDDNVGVTGYHVFLNGNLLDSTETNRYELNGLTPDEEYRLSISAYDEAGNVSQRSREFVIKLPINELEMSIFPNPSNGSFTIKLDNGVVQENTSIQIITLSGQIIYQIPIPERTQMPYIQEINLTPIVAEGSYIISIIENNVRTQSLRIIITRNILYQAGNNEFGIKLYGIQPLIIPVTLSSEPNQK